MDPALGPGAVPARGHPDRHGPISVLRRHPVSAPLRLPGRWSPLCLIDELNAMLRAYYGMAGGMTCLPQ